MNHRLRSPLPALLGLAALALPGTAPAFERPLPDPHPVPPEIRPEAPPAPAGYVLVEAGLWAQHLDQPESEFQAARAALDRHDLKAAVASVRRAAGYVRAEGSRADKSARAALLGAAQALDDLAARLDQGLLPDSGALGPVFANADHLMAGHRLQLARLAVGDDQFATVGEQLGAAADDSRAELAWSGVGADPEQDALLRRVDQVADGLRQPGSVGDASTDAALDDLGRLLAGRR